VRAKRQLQLRFCPALLAGSYLRICPDLAIETHLPHVGFWGMAGMLLERTFGFVVGLIPPWRDRLGRAAARPYLSGNLF